MHFDSEALFTMQYKVLQEGCVFLRWFMPSLNLDPQLL